MQEFLSPEKVDIEIAATAGALLAMLLAGKLDWKMAVTMLFCGMIGAFYFAIPICEKLGWTASMHGPVGLFIGLAAMYIFGAATAMLKKFQVDPLALVTKFMAAWKGMKND